MTTIDDRVRAGMAFLDERYPDHVQRFDPERFDILGVTVASGRMCALLQATGADDFMGALECVGLDYPGSGVPLGFSPRLGECSALNAAWLAAYAVRKAALIEVES